MSFFFIFSWSDENFISFSDFLELSRRYDLSFLNAFLVQICEGCFRVVVSVKRCRSNWGTERVKSLCTLFPWMVLYVSKIQSHKKCTSLTWDSCVERKIEREKRKVDQMIFHEQRVNWKCWVLDWNVRSNFYLPAILSRLWSRTLRQDLLLHLT